MPPSTFRRGSSEASEVIGEATTSEFYNSFTEDLIDLRELISIIGNLDLEVVAFDTAEFIPGYDYKGITKFVAGKIIKEILA